MLSKYPPPPQTTLIHYIIQTCALENIMVTQDDIHTSMDKEGNLNPDAVGHFRAINFVLETASSGNVLRGTLQSIKSNNQADAALYWLREIHSLIMKPVVFVASNDGLIETMSMKDVGEYRLMDRWITLDHPLPRYWLVKPLLKECLTELTTFHFDNVGLLGNSLTQQNAKKFIDAAMKFHLQLQCIHPFVDGTGRTARLVENMLRLNWGLPWKTILIKDRQKYVDQIRAYEDSNEWQATLTKHGNDKDFI